jgi:4-amino-4-deoxy-L-arabinose transferase
MHAFLAVAAPWYLLCYLRNGSAFLDTFFWRHQVGRFATDALQHGQPFWFYAPVLLAGLVPWTPLAVLLLRRKLYGDRRLVFLLVTAAFGFVFFSAATNKLPGYLLPLVPLVAALAGVALDAADRAKILLLACAALLAVVPAAVEALAAAAASTGTPRRTRC